MMKRYKKQSAILFIGFATFALAFLTLSSVYAASGHKSEKSQMDSSAMLTKMQSQMRKSPAIKLAVSVLVPTKGNKVHGVVYFKQDGSKVHVTGKVVGLEPNTTHGFHIHQYGDLTSDDGSSLGGHYNPDKHAHDLPFNKPRHAGDLGSITADSKGVAKVDVTVNNITVDGKRNSIIGRGVVVHAKKDTGAQPTGAAGPRIGVGVIGIAQTKASK